MPTFCPFLTVPFRVGLQSVIMEVLGHTISFFETIIIVDDNTIEKKRNLKYTRGIWKVLSMVYYLSNRFTNPIMFGIILKNYSSSMLWHKFHEDIIMQT